MVERKEIETGTEDLLAYIEDGVAVLTMNRPERRNALSAGMIQGLADALAVAETADDVGCVVLTGAGGAFCAGGLPLRWLTLTVGPPACPDADTAPLP